MTKNHTITTQFMERINIKKDSTNYLLNVSFFPKDR